MTVSTASIERRNAEGDLQNADTITVGIVRDADSVVILAPTSTGILNPSTGIYSYDYSSLALDPTQGYTLTWTFTTVGLLDTVTELIPGYSSRRSLRAYRRAMVGMNQLGPWVLQTTSAASDAANQLVIAELTDVDLGTSSRNGLYAFIVNGALAGQQRRVATNGFTASSGTLTVARAYSGLPASGVDVELLSRLPAIRDELGRVGLRECINWALEQCPQVIRLDFTGISGAFSYGLEDYPWLTDAVQVGPVYDPVASAGLNPDPHAGAARLRLNGELPLLELDSPFTTGQTFAVDLMIPGDRWIRSGGAWGQSDAGLVADDDEALVDRRLVEQVALAYAYRAMAGLTEPREADYWDRKAVVQERRAAQIRFWSSARVGTNDASSVIVGGRGYGLTGSSYGLPGRSF